MQFTIGGLGKMEFLEDDVWQLKVLFLEQWATNVYSISAERRIERAEVGTSSSKPPSNVSAQHQMGLGRWQLSHGHN